MREEQRKMRGYEGTKFSRERSTVKKSLGVLSLRQSCTTAERALGHRCLPRVSTHGVPVFCVPAPWAVAVAARLTPCLTLIVFETLIPKATHPKIPSLMELPSKEYSTTGSLLAASPRKMLSDALVVNF